jgi:hypothetical protein
LETTLDNIRSSVDRGTGTNKTGTRRVLLLVGEVEGFDLDGIEAEVHEVRINSAKPYLTQIA